jgi:choline-sulfatase
VEAKAGSRVAVGRSQPDTPSPPMRTALLLALGSLALAGPACGPSGHTERPRNLLIVCVDTLRTDLLGAYGDPGGLSPRLDALARESVVFEQVHSAASWTLPSVAATFTSQVPSTTGLWTFESRLGEGFETLAERFREAGYTTHGIASHVFFQERYGLVQGFETFDDELAHRKGEPGWREVTSPIVARKASEWLAQRAGADGRPWLLFLHFFDPHLPYVDHEAGPGHVPAPAELARYKSEIRFTDGHVGHVLDALAAAGLADDTAVLFFSDHGEAFREHPPIQRHSYGLYDEELRVPLMLRVPGFAPRRVSAPVRSVDVLPTIVELFGLEDPQAALRAGRSLVGAMQGTVEDRLEPPALAEIRLKDGFHTNALVSGRFKLIEKVSTGQFELYDLASDPLERRDLAASDPERLAALKRALAEAIENAAALGERFGPGGAVEHTPAELENLQELGYGGEE